MSALTRWIVCVWAALVAAVLLVSLSACGGGGGGGGGGGAVAAADPAPVAIVTPPADVTVAAGGSATFSVGATGDGLAYQWQSSSDGTQWTDLPGASASSFVLNPVSVADSGTRYRVVVGNITGIQASTAAVLTVTASGGGGGVAGVPDACRPLFALPAGTVIEATASLSTGAQPITGTFTVVGPATFQGRSVTEVDIVTSLLSAPLTTRSFATFDAAAGALTVYGVQLHTAAPDGSIVMDTEAVTTPPVVDTRYALQPGQSVTLTASDVQTSVTTINGNPQPPQTTTETTTSTIEFVGMETLTTPAGSFHACKYLESGTGVANATTWMLAGYGIGLKSVTASVTTTTTSIRVNGEPLTHFP